MDRALHELGSSTSSTRCLSRPETLYPTRGNGLSRSRAPLPTASCTPVLRGQCPITYLWTLYNARNLSMAEPCLIFAATKPEQEHATSNTNRSAQSQDDCRELMAAANRPLPPRQGRRFQAISQRHRRCAPRAQRTAAPGQDADEGLH